MSKGYHYDGDVNENNQRHGIGRAFFKNGDEYNGEYANGKRHGKGVYRFRNGAVYDGFWENGRKDGYGVFIYPDGSKYDGEWLDDERSGIGIYTYPNGDRYEGQWNNHTRDGPGRYIYTSARLQYIGNWVKGRRDGMGKMDDYFPEREKPSPEWHDLRVMHDAEDHKNEQLLHHVKTEEKHDPIVTVPGAEGAIEAEGRTAWWKTQKPQGLEPGKFNLDSSLIFLDSQQGSSESIRGQTSSHSKSKSHSKTIVADAHHEPSSNDLHHQGSHHSGQDPASINHSHQGPTHNPPGRKTPNQFEHEMECDAKTPSLENLHGSASDIHSHSSKVQGDQN